MATKLTPIHPGEVLLADFLEPFELSQYRLARDISVAPRRINEIVHGTRAVTADTALRLGRYFGTSPRFLLALQSRYDLEVEQDRLGTRLRSEVSVYARVSYHGLLLTLRPTSREQALFQGAAAAAEPSFVVRQLHHWRYGATHPKHFSRRSAHTMFVRA